MIDMSERVAALVDGSLDDEARRELEHCLRESATARQQFRSAMRFHQQLRTELQVAAGIDLAQAPSARQRPWLLALPLALSAALVCGWLWWPSDPAPSAPWSLRQATGEEPLAALLPGADVPWGQVVEAPGLRTTGFDWGVEAGALRLGRGSQWRHATLEQAPALLSGVAGLKLREPSTVDVPGLGRIRAQGRVWLTVSPWLSEVVVLEGEAVVAERRLGPGERLWRSGSSEIRFERLALRQVGGLWLHESAVAAYAAGRFVGHPGPAGPVARQWTQPIGFDRDHGFLTLGSIGPQAQLTFRFEVEFERGRNGNYDLYFGESLKLPELVDTDWPIDSLRRFGLHADSSGVQVVVEVSLVRIAWSELGPIHELNLHADGEERLRGWIYADPLRLDVHTQSVTVRLDHTELRLAEPLRD